MAVKEQIKSLSIIQNKNVVIKIDLETVIGLLDLESRKTNGFLFPSITLKQTTPTIEAVHVLHAGIMLDCVELSEENKSCSQRARVQMQCFQEFRFF